MRFNNQTKLILTIICMVICLFAMFMGIFLGAKELDFTDFGEISFNNVDAHIEMFVIGHDTSKNEDGLNYFYGSTTITKERQEGTSFIGCGELNWKKKVTEDTLKVENITMVLAVTNRATDGTFLCISLPELSNNISNAIHRTFYSGVGIMEEAGKVFLSANNLKYRGVALDEGPQSIESGSGIPAGYTYIIEIVYTLEDLNKDFGYRDNKFEMSLTSQTVSNFGQSSESEPAIQ